MTENNNKDLVAPEAPEGAILDALDIIEKRNALFQRVMQVAIQATSPADWIDQDGKPYLQGSGAEKVARRFGVRIYDVSIERENLTDDNGPYYLYTVTGKAGLGSGLESIESIGTASSRDKLFSHGGKKPMQDIDIGNVKKKAYTNFMGNAITRLLGIRNLTWDVLQLYGIEKNGKASVQYKSAAAKAAETNSAKKAESDTKLPYWHNEYEGKKYLFARSGQHFTTDLLANLGFQLSKKTPGLYFTTWTEQIERSLMNEYNAAEATKAEGGQT